MKIRSGFVSNSSTASFIVRFKENVFTPANKKIEIILTPQQVKKLEKYGFQKTSAYYPFQFEFDPDYKKRKKADKYWHSYGYGVSCNQDEVVEFLLKNKIPFTADIHYDQWCLHYDGKDTVIKAINFGKLLQMRTSWKELNQTKKIQKFTVKEYLNRNSH